MSKENEQEKRRPWIFYLGCSTFDISHHSLLTTYQVVMDLTTTLGRLRLSNPVLVASGTFGYAREMAGVVDFARLGGIVPKTVTRQPRIGNPPPRTFETASGMLNAIGLDNDGIDYFLRHHLPYLRTLPTAVIGNIAGEDVSDFIAM